MPKQNNGSGAENTYMKIGERLRQMRKDRLGILQEDVGNALGVASNAVSLWERGGKMTVDNLMALQHKFDLCSAWLLYGEDTFEGKLWLILQDLEPKTRESLKAYILDLAEQEKNRQARADAPQP
jgi:transcriptional regulator with XRE-family HTH domain